jgi:hypothetical protein
MVTSSSMPQARSLLGEYSTLVVGQFVVVEPDPDRPRVFARGPLRFMTAPSGAYSANCVGWASPRTRSRICPIGLWILWWRGVMWTPSPRESQSTCTPGGPGGAERRG